MLLLKFFVNIIVSLAQKFNKKGAILRRLEYNYTSSPFKYFDRFFTKNDQLICLDIGASVGHTASHFNNLFPNAKIYAFEPTPDSFKQLQTMHCDNKNINCFQLALSDSEGENDFYAFSKLNESQLIESDVNFLNQKYFKENYFLK
jgi:fibrillarin-like rRNA methylase